MNLSRLPALSLLAATLAHAFAAQAQTAPAATPQTATDRAAPQPIQKVEIKGSAEAYDPRRDDTATKIVVNHEEIIKYGDSNALDVLKRLPGITVSGGSGRGTGEVRMRGLGSGYTQVLINGERAPAGFSLDSLAPEVIERIEVLRAASAEFSTQSIAGTINIVLKKAIKNAQREVSAGYAYSDTSRIPSVNLQLSDRSGKLSYSVTASLRRVLFNRHPTANETGVDQGGRVNLQRNQSGREDGTFDAVNIAPRLNWTLDGGDTLTLQGFYNYFAVDFINVTEVVTPVGAPPAYPFIDWRLENSNSFGKLDLNYAAKLAQGAKLDVKVGAEAGKANNDSKRRGYASNGGAFLLDNRVVAETRNDGFSSTGKYSTPIVEGHSLAMGWDGGISTRDDTRVQREQPLPGAVPVNSSEAFSADVRRLAVYAQDEWIVNPRWSVYGGARWEGIVTDTSGDSFVGARTRTSVWSPIFQTLYKLPDTKGDQLRLAVTRTYKAPPTQSLIPRRFTTANNSSTEPDNAGNTNLRPELALGLDVSFDHYLAEGAMISVSGSTRRIDDYTRTSITLGADGRWLAIPVNDGTASTRGLEFEAKLPLSLLMANARAIDLRLNLSRNWSSVDAVPGPNNRLDQQTPYAGTFALDYKAGPLTAGGSFTCKSGGPVRVSLRQRSDIVIRRELDLYALWKFDPKTQLRLAVTNALGQDFEFDNTYADDFGAVRRTSVFEAPASFSANLILKF